MAGSCTPARRSASSSCGCCAAPWPRLPTRRDAPWLGGAIFFGGIVGPVLLMAGLRATPGPGVAAAEPGGRPHGAARLVCVPRELRPAHRSRHGCSSSPGASPSRGQPGAAVRVPLGALAVAAACLCWAIDNNLTQKVSGGDPLLAAIKGARRGRGQPRARAVRSARAGRPCRRSAAALSSGSSATARAWRFSSSRCATSARRAPGRTSRPRPSSAPRLARRCSASPGPALWLAAVLMGAGVWLHLTERHEHEHA